MDPTNKLQNGSLEAKKLEQAQALTSSADIFMEESLANMITLQYFAAAKKKVQNFEDDSLVKDFMELQPDAYKFGITQYELLHTDWKLWRNNKSQIKFWVDWSQKVLPNIEELRKEYSLCF